MQDLNEILDQIPIRHDVFSYIMFLGITIGFLLSFVILLRSYKKNIAFRFLALFLIIQATITLDNFLCYTGLMKYTIGFNDSSEPLVLILGPSIYLFVYTLLKRKRIALKHSGLHLIPAILYGISQLQYYLQSDSIKLNAYLNAYFPKLKTASVPNNIDYSYLLIKDEFRWLILASFTIYILLSFRILYFYLRRQNTSLSRKTIHNKYSFTRNLVISFLIVFIIIFSIYLNYEDDSGDHYITVFVNFTVIIIALIMVSESRFFENTWIAEKYETSSFKDQKISIEEIKEFIEKDKFYLQSSASLKKLSEELNSSSNYISQVINTSTGLNFNDFINQYRIETSKLRLTDPNYSHLTIEAIGNSVGFNSKSTFYNSFRKHVAMSPKAFVTLKKAT
ncbi:AraC family transcriptional regulator [Aquimarina sp. AD1]|uniref:helix-turn-helix domain-containing protein n=1 Tax=Aquimarina sp. (strain AD1) TaxID=1714848 RepID=UPI000E490EF3|nr:helix-turn-helix domain-containing protein [Aquimarina sp. AD1]AXT56920.1 AraC family transcriptional regulator [Aquimarina sp. AD1]RKN32112.1 helix-turn-helix domain-containing protein [Aquimarina sp. AD1]